MFLQLKKRLDDGSRGNCSLELLYSLCRVFNELTFVVQNEDASEDDQEENEMYAPFEPAISLRKRSLSP
jgi:hypothetical protein